MKRSLSISAVTAAGLWLLALVATTGAWAQEPELAPEKVALARKVILATQATKPYNAVLPDVADRLKTAFIRGNPQLELGIIDVVDEVALDLVARRGELDDAVARLWAANFETEELQAILDFYTTDVGKKLADFQPRLLQETLLLASNWERAISEDMRQRVAERLKQNTNQ